MVLKTIPFLIGLTLVASRPDPFYRKDYTYVDQFDAFYKLHWDLSGSSWSSAFLACGDEESTIFYPKMKDEWTVVKSLVSAMKIKPNVSDIFVGMHDEFGLGEFITVDGQPTPNPVLDKDQPTQDSQNNCVTMDIETGSYKLDSCEAEHLKPFVCKKKVIQSCPTVDTGYTLVKPIKKCYKANQRKKTWPDAMHTCFMEGGILAVIENSAEAEVIRNLKNFDEEFNYHFVGFRRLYPNGDFYTVTGHKFDDTFYPRWNSNTEEYTRYDCGVVYEYSNNIYTKTSNCLEPRPFICEMTSNI